MVAAVHSVVSDSLRLHELQHARLPCPSLYISLSLLKLMYTESVIPPNHLIVCHPLLLPSTLPHITVLLNGKRTQILQLQLVSTQCTSKRLASKATLQVL